MRENTNKAIAVNSIILYVRMILVTICSILTTRFALKALGVVDFGLYSLLGGVISFITIFNTIMLSTSNRYIAVAIGKGNIEEANVQFNVNFIVHVCIAVVTAIMAFPIGDWYIFTFVNYDGDISNALMVYNISIAASIFSFIGVPYHGLLMAKERFIVFSGIDVLVHIGKLIAAYILIFHFYAKLLIYTLAIAFFTAIPVLVYYIYCNRYYYDIVKFKLVKQKRKYLEVTKFSLWVSIGAVATIGKNQGATMLVNAFFNTIMNTAMGIANSICVYINMFSQNVIQPMAPQITKSYAAGDIKRTNELLLMSTKYAFLLMFLASSPFLVAPDWLLKVWLGEVPPYAIDFLILMITDNLVLSLNAGISNLIFASGKIKPYQIITSLLNIFSIFGGFIVLRLGMPAYALIYTYIFMSVVRVIAIQFILHKTLGYDNRFIILKSYLPSFMVVLCFLPAVFVKVDIHPLLKIFFSAIYLSTIIFFLGFDKVERTALLSKIFRFKKKR